jgi:cysteinyl-tRNA synthetase
MHTKFLQVDGGKMSKRLGNCYSIDDVVAKGYEPRALRFCLLRGQYRTPLNFTWAIMDESKSVLENLDDLAARLRRAMTGHGAAASSEAGLELVEECQAEFTEAMDDDLNTPRAIAALMQLRTAVLEERLGASAAAAGNQFLVHTANKVLGCVRVEEESLDAEIERAIAARQDARKRKDFQASDRIRDELLAKGIVLEDTPKGVIWKRK